MDGLKNLFWTLMPSKETASLIVALIVSIIFILGLVKIYEIIKGSRLANNFKAYTKLRTEMRTKLQTEQTNLQTNDQETHVYVDVNANPVINVGNSFRSNEPSDTMVVPAEQRQHLMLGAKPHTNEHEVQFEHTSEVPK